MDDTVHGYPEINFFKQELFMKNVSAKYQTLFADINLYNDVKSNSTNYEYLFNLTGSDGKSDPESTSLFNFDTINALMFTGIGAADIIAN